MQKIMVIGAAGVLGNLICLELFRLFNAPIKLIVTDYKIERGKNLAKSFNRDVDFHYLDINEEENITQVVKNVDIVIIALKQKTPNIQKACITNKVLCIDVTPFYDFVEKIINLNQMAQENEVASIVMSGYFPGLSGLMVKKAISSFEEVKEVNVGLLQNTNAKAGISGMLDMLKIISEQVNFENKVVSGFTKKRKMLFLDNPSEREVRLIHHSEKHVLEKNLALNNINFWTSWDVKIFNKQISLLRKIGFIAYVPKFNKNLLSTIVKHNPNKGEPTFLTVEVKGIIENKERIKRLSLSTFSDYSTTAMITASLAKIASRKNIKGVVCPLEITTLEEILSEIKCPDIIYQEVDK